MNLVRGPQEAVDELKTSGESDVRRIVIRLVLSHRKQTLALFEFNAATNKASLGSLRRLPGAPCCRLPNAVNHYIDRKAHPLRAAGDACEIHHRDAQLVHPRQASQADKAAGSAAGPRSYRVALGLLSPDSYQIVAC